MTPHPSTHAPFALNASGASNRGLHRPLNEDSFLAEFPVFIVADGMGGHDAGDRASAAVVETYAGLVGRDNLTVDDVLALTPKAQERVAQVANQTERGAGSTLAGVVAVRDRSGKRFWLVLNIGDSRVYRAVGEHFEQVTIDHSLAQELIDRGDLRPDEVHTFEGRNVITRAVGDLESTPDYWLLPMVTGERILVCSDGLTGELNDEAIRVGLTFGGSTERTATTLIDRALEHGGTDNVTVVVLEVVDGGLPLDSVTPTSGAVAGLPLSSEDEHTIESQTRPTQRRVSRD